MKNTHGRVLHWLGKLRRSRHAELIAAERASACVEVLESRISPATLINATTVTYTDADGDNVTITASLPIFKAATINRVLHFDTGSVNGSNAAHQQLQLINLATLGAKASGTSLTVDAVQAGGDGFVNVGFIQGATLDLGAVIVDGDLGRLVAGNKTTSTPGVDTLTVRSIGKMGVSTQAAGGDLVTAIRGPVTALTVATDIVGANIGVGDPVKNADGKILSINVGGSLIGGSTAFSGAIRASGEISFVNVGGSLIGGAGESSGVIGTAGQLVLVSVGSLAGGSGKLSGALLSTGAMGAVTVVGSVTGGIGESSGAIGTLARLASVTIGGGVQGGTGLHSGWIFSGNDMGPVNIGGVLQGGHGTESGQVLTFGNLAGVTIGGTVAGGVGEGSGLISSVGSMGDVNISGSLFGGAGLGSGGISSLLGSIANLNVSGRIASSEVFGKMGIASITANTLGLAGSGIESSFFSAPSGPIGAITSTGTSAGVFLAVSPSHGIYASTFMAGGSIGDINSTTLANGSDSDGISSSDFLAGLGIGKITAKSMGIAFGGNGIDESIFQASGGSIGNIIATTADISQRSGILGSAFNAKQDIGAINATGDVSYSLFIAGIGLGSDFFWGVSSLTSFNGTFDDVTAAQVGFGGTGTATDVLGTAPAKIGAVTLSNVPTAANAKLTNAALVAGIIGSGTDGHFGTTDDVVLAGSSVGAITAPGGIDPIVVESGAIGNITVSNGSITGFQEISEEGTVKIRTSFLAVDLTGAGIGNVNVTQSAAATFTGAAIDFVEFLSNNGVGSIVATSALGHGMSDGKIEGDADQNGTGAIGDIKGTSTAEGMDGMRFVMAHAGSSIGIIDGEALGGSGEGGSGIGIYQSIFRASGGDIDAIRAISSETAIQGSAFDALGDIGEGAVASAVFAEGRVSGSLFVAGIDLGGNFANDLSAAGALGDSAAAGFGFGGTGANADSIGSPGSYIGQITIGNPGDSVGTGVLEMTTILAGVTGAGADTHFGTIDDAFTSGSKVGDISTGGDIATVFVESGAIGFTAIDQGQISNTTYHALDSAGNGIGRILVTEVINGAQNDGITQSAFISNAAIQSVTVDLSGFRDTDSLGDNGIDQSTFSAVKNIGDISVTNASFGISETSFTFGHGISASTFKAGTGAAALGGIGFIDVTVSNPSGISAAIDHSTFDASSGVASTGGISGILAERNSESGADIADSVFRGNGSIGVASGISIGNLRNSLITASGSIGTIFAEGGVSNSQILAGIDLGSDFAWGGTGAAADTLAAGQVIGNVDVGGAFHNSDMAASTDPGADHVFGNGNDSNVGVGGTIGSLVIGAPITRTGAFLPDAVATHAIIANSVGNQSITLGGTFHFLSGVIDNNVNDVVDAGDVRVTQFAPIFL